MKVCFNGWFGGFFEKTNPGLHVGFFIDLFGKVYDEPIEIGDDIESSDILCEFDMLLGSTPTNMITTNVNDKKWKHTYLFTGESHMKCRKEDYTCVLVGERNHKNVVNVPLFVPYIYTNNFMDKLQTPSSSSDTTVPKNDVCVFISNPQGKTRNRFLERLEAHFNVHYAGRYKNNIGGYFPHEYNSPEYTQFVKQYKFIISMENSRDDTYITEKIVHGLIAKTVPVYWGSGRVYDYFNKNRILCLEKECDDQDMDKLIVKMKLIASSEMLWKRMVNLPVFPTPDNTLPRTMDHIVSDIKSLTQKDVWSSISSVHCVCNPVFEPGRHADLQTMFKGLNIPDHRVKYISPTYKHTITNEIYNKYTENQLVQVLRKGPMTKSELSLIFNFKAVFENIVKNYSDGLFMVFESDVMISHDTEQFGKFIDDVKELDWDVINCGMFQNDIYSIPTTPWITGYRNDLQSWNPSLVTYIHENSVDGEKYIEDITNPTDTFRLIRKFTPRCCDSYVWKYDAIVKFLHFMNTFTDYSAPFDYYMCHFLEMNIDVKHYWSVNEFFKQGSNLNLCESTLKCDIVY